MKVITFEQIKKLEEISLRVDAASEKMPKGVSIIKDFEYLILELRRAYTMIEKLNDPQ